MYVCIVCIYIYSFVRTTHTHIYIYEYKIPFTSLTLIHTFDQDINIVDNSSDVNESQPIDINSIKLNIIMPLTIVNPRQVLTT
jgi:hypothetical protein